MSEARRKTAVRGPGDREKAKRLICQIIAQNGGTFEGLTRLYKTFYIAHLYHWQENEGLLSSHPIVRMPKGPGIDGGASILREMERDGWIERLSQPKGPYTENVYRLLLTDPSAYALEEDERRAVAMALTWIGAQSGTEVSQISHEFSRTWRTAGDGEILDIYLDLIDDEEYEAREQVATEAEALVNAHFR